MLTTTKPIDYAEITPFLTFQSVSNTRRCPILIVTRKSGTSIHIGDDIVVHIREIHGKEISVGIEAPRTTRVLRGELVEVKAEGEGN